MGTAIKCPVSDRVKQLFVIFDIRGLSARMSKITSDGLTQSGTGTRMATVGVKGLTAGIVTNKN